MKISEDLINKLKIAGKFSENIVLVPGKKQNVKNGNSLFMSFEINEDKDENGVEIDTMPNKIGIYKLNNFIFTLESIKDNDVQFKSDKLIISNDTQKINYRLGDIDILENTSYSNKFNPDSLEREFSNTFVLTNEDFKNIMKLANIFSCKTLYFNVNEGVLTLNLLTELGEKVYQQEIGNGDFHEMNDCKFFIEQLTKIYDEKEGYGFDLIKFEKSDLMFLNIKTKLASYYMGEQA